MGIIPNQIVWLSPCARSNVCGFLVVGASLCACATKPALTPAQAIALAPTPLALVAFDGATGATIEWREVLDRVAAADAVFVGENHDDATAHAVEHALVDAFFASHKPAAVSLEFLERDDQAATDAYLAGSSTMDEFITATKSKDWAGADTWIPWYQPMIDSAKRSHAKVVAANAPRKYVTQARVEGYGVCIALPSEERALFEVDETISRDGDWERLRELMVEMHRERAKEGEAGPSDPDADHIDSIHRSQRMWDKTMGMSAAKTFAQKTAVIHIAGGFHLEQRLGTVAQFSHVCPDAKILVISLQPSASTEIEEKEIKGADIVIHTKGPLRPAQK